MVEAHIKSYLLLETIQKAHMLAYSSKVAAHALESIKIQLR